MTPLASDSVGAETPAVKTFTPGPWHVVTASSCGDDWSVASTGNFVIETTNIKADEIGDEAADARLIAASPDLLEALQEILVDFTALDKGNVGRSLRSIARARAAIRKATKVPS